MPIPSDGTPRENRSPVYVQPSRRQPLLWVSVGIATLTGLALFGFYIAGARRTLSPGPLAAHHARLDVQCSQCHQTGNAVVDLRCERCHDAGLTDSLLYAAHLGTGKGEATAADVVKTVTCASCHRDHQGRRFVMKAVDDGECAVCHRATPSLAKHVEFAIVRAGVSASEGMTFGHKGHLKDVAEKSAARCQYCHEPTPDNRGFKPIDFERHCAACHTDRGNDNARILAMPTGYVSPDLLVAPSALPDFWKAQTRAQTEANSRGNVRGTNLLHKDGWVIANALRLRQAIDGEGARVELANLTARESTSSDPSYMRASGARGPAALAATIADVRREIAAIDAQLNGTAPPAGDLTAIQNLANVVQALGATLRQSDGAAAQAAGLSGDALTLMAGTTAPAADAAAFERQRQTLTTALDAIEQRADASGRSDLRARADALRLRIDALAPAAQDVSPADLALLQQRIVDLEGIIRLARSVAGAGGEVSTDELEATRRAVGQQVAGGVSPSDFASVRRQLLAVLDAVDARGDEGLRARVASVRLRLLSLRLSSGDPVALRTARAARQRLLDRLVLEQELGAASDQNDLPVTPARRMDRPVEVDLKRQGDDRLILSQLRQPVTALSLDPDRIEQYKSALTSLVTPYSVYNHAPHVTGATCDSCHASAIKSELASDVNVPGVATCRTCHTASKVNATCVECHVYHGGSPHGPGR